MMPYVLFPLSLEFQKIKWMVRIFKLCLNFSYRWIEINAHIKKLEKVLFIENRKT